MSEGHYSQMVVKAQKRINQFDWGKTAKDTLKLYQEIYSTR
jgi:hypothetical protein